MSSLVFFVLTFSIFDLYYVLQFNADISQKGDDNLNPFESYALKIIVFKYGGWDFRFFQDDLELL